MPARRRLAPPSAVVVAALAVLGAFAASATTMTACVCAPDLFELPANPVPERGPRGVGPFDDDDDGATCASGDGCFDCDLLDSDCPDGVACVDDGLCASACFAPDPDCARLDDGLLCTTGEQCASLRCVAVDGVGTCARPCDDGACAAGFTCVSRGAGLGGDALCVPASC